MVFWGPIKFIFCCPQSCIILQHGWTDILHLVKALLACWQEIELFPFLHGAELDVYLVSDSGGDTDIYQCAQSQVWRWVFCGHSDMSICQDQPEIVCRMFCWEGVYGQMWSYQKPLSVFWTSVWDYISVQVFNHCRKGVHHIIIWKKFDKYRNCFQECKTELKKVCESGYEDICDSGIKPIWLLLKQDSLV